MNIVKNTSTEKLIYLVLDKKKDRSVRDAGFRAFTLSHNNMKTGLNGSQI